MIPDSEKVNAGAQTTWPRFACPRCHHLLQNRAEGWICKQENLRFTSEEGIPSFILPERRIALEGFLETYQHIRRTEGWGVAALEYVQELPYRDETERHSRVWAIRARTFDAFLDHLSKQSLRSTPRILDIGAGNCWFSARMARRGFQVVALDISLDPVDGLGALVLLPRDLRARICPVRADFDSLPFTPGEFDLVVFNASLHYSSDAACTLATAMEVLDRRGILYILDSPFYTGAEAGEQMIQEWNHGIMRRFNRQVSEPRPKGYLTLEMLNQLHTRYRVECITPAYGVRWALRPYIARFLRRREPATFRIAAIYRK